MLKISFKNEIININLYFLLIQIGMAIVAISLLFYLDIKIKISVRKIVR